MKSKNKDSGYLFCNRNGNKLTTRGIAHQLKKLASDNDLELLLPALNLEDDQKEIEELLANGYSSKTWESKCLIGQPAKDKTPEDENVIIEYYEKELIPKVLKKTTQGFIDYNYFL